jgi:hypothetical protein
VLGEVLIRARVDHRQTAILHRPGALAAAQDGDRNAYAERQNQQQHRFAYVILEAHLHCSPT